MLGRISWPLWIPVFLVVMASGGLAKDYIIYTIAQEVPNGEADHVPRKNYYINIGQGQGIQPGTLLDVYRPISALDPYNHNHRYQYRVKVGEIKVLHSEPTAAIAEKSKLSQGNSVPLLEIKDFMIGDQVTVHIEK